MDDNANINESNEKEPHIAEGMSPTIGTYDNTRRPSQGGQRILFAPDPRVRMRQQSEGIAMLPLSRTFSRQKTFSSYSVKADEENERVRRVTSRRTIEPHTRLPTGTFSNDCVLKD